MAGLNNIIDRIKKDSEENVNAIIKEANDYAAGLMADAKKKATDEVDKINKKCESELKSIAERSISSCELKKKQMALVAKQNIIMDTVEKAKEKIVNLPEKEYVEYFKKVFEKNVPNKNCTMKLSKKDLGRVDVLEALGLAAIAAKNGSVMTISKEAANIKSGFILDFGGVEGNCSFESLIDQNLDTLIDKVNSIYFA